MPRVTSCTIVFTHNTLENFAGYIAGKLFHNDHIMNPLEFGRNMLVDAVVKFL
jgi:hypothetical protein